MDYIKKGEIILFGVFLTSLILSVAVLVGAQEAIMNVETNILTGFEEVNVSGMELSIEVPDYIDLGNVTVGQLSVNETRVRINNTGTTEPIRVTAELVDSSKEIYQYLQIKDTAWKFINDGFMTGNITTGKTVYLRFDLRGYTGVLDEDLISYNNSIRFIATAA